MQNDERIGLELDLGQSTQSANQFAQSLQAVSVTANQSTVPALKAVDEAAQKTTQSHADFGRGIMNVSYAVQDFTSQLGTRGLAGAFAAIQNNIPGILTGLGMGTGFAGVASIAAVGAAALASAFSGVSKEAKEAAEATEKLLEAAKKVAEMRTGEQEKEANTIGGWLKDMPGRTVQQGITRTLTERARAQGIANEREQLQQFGVITESADDFVRRMGPEIQKDAQRYYQGLSTDAASRGLVASMAQERPGNFPGGFADDILSFDRDTGDRDLADAEAFGQRAHDAGARRRDFNRRWNQNAKRLDARTQRDVADDEDADRDFKRRRAANARNLDRRTEEDIDNEESLTRADEKAKRERERVARGGVALAHTETAARAEITRSQHLIEDTREKQRQWDAERVLMQRNPQASYKNVQEAAKRTLDLMDRGMNTMNALATAEAEQNQKIMHLEGRMSEIERQMARNRNPVMMRRGAR